MTAAGAPPGPPDQAKAALLEAWNAGLELGLYRELAAQAAAAQGMLLEGDCAGALGELTVALEKLEEGQKGLG